MIYGDFNEDGVNNNLRFIAGNKLDRDGSNSAFILLQEILDKKGIKLNTPDVNAEVSPLFSLDLNAMESRPLKIKYAIILETENIKPNNSNENLLQTYHRVFSWNRHLPIKHDAFTQIFFPNELNTNWSVNKRRQNCICMVAANKSIVLSTPGIKDLYLERIELIKKLSEEKYKPLGFHLYGTGWQVTFLKCLKNSLRTIRNSGELGRHQWMIYFGQKNFDYRGPVNSKRQLLLKYDFSICYENLGGYENYVTEKIIDCFNAGVIPIYKGASNITDLIPENCFIDANRFRNNDELLDFLKQITFDQIIEYRTCIKSFLTSKSAEKFTNTYFAKAISSAILCDIEKFSPKNI